MKGTGAGIVPSGPGMGHPCVGRRGSSVVPECLTPDPRSVPAGQGGTWVPLCPVGSAHPLRGEGLFGAPSVGGCEWAFHRPQGWGQASVDLTRCCPPGAQPSSWARAPKTLVWVPEQL